MTLVFHNSSITDAWSLFISEKFVNIESVTMMCLRNSVGLLILSTKEKVGGSESTSAAAVSGGKSTGAAAIICGGKATGAAAISGGKATGANMFRRDSPRSRSIGEPMFADKILFTKNLIEVFYFNFFIYVKRLIIIILFKKLNNIILYNGEYNYKYRLTF